MKQLLRSPKTRTLLLASLVSVLCLIVMVGVVEVFSWLSEGENRRLELEAMYQRIPSPDGVTIAYAGNCTGPGSASGSPRVSARFCAVGGSQSTFVELEQSYRRAFAEVGWHQDSAGVFVISDNVRLEILEIRPNVPFGVSIYVPLNTLQQMELTYQTTYILILRSCVGSCLGF